MTAPRTIDRKTFLSSSAVTLASIALGCSEDGGSGASTGSTMGSTSGGTTTGTMGTMGATTTGGGTSSTTVGTQATSTSSTGAGGTSSTSAGGAGGTSTAGGNGGMGGASTSDGGTGNVGAGGTAGTGGTSYTCMTDTDNGNHSHPLTVPGEDVEYGYAADPYVLEDGGTGHTHTVALSAYDFFYLQGGQPVTVESSEDDAHTHMCVINCTAG